MTATSQHKRKAWSVVIMSTMPEVALRLKEAAGDGFDQSSVCGCAEMRSRDALRRLGLK